MKIERGRASDGSTGFTLMEALVALAILAIASVGLLRATEAHTDTVRGLQTRAVAQWVAENRLVELGLQTPPVVATVQTVEMLDRLWTVRVEVKPSEDPDLALVNVAVSPQGARQPAARLTGFVDLRATPA